MDDIPHRRFGLLRWLTGNPRFALLRGALIVSGLSLIVFSATFLLAVDWGGTPAPSAADEPTPVNLTDGTSAIAGDPTATILPTATPAASTTPIGTPLPLLTPTPALGDPSAVSPAPAAVPPASTAVPPVPTAVPPAPAAPTAVPPTAVPPTAVPTPQPPSCPTAPMGSFAQALFDAINSARADNGMSALGLNSCVVFVANLRSEDMAAKDYFAHESPHGDTAFSLMNEYNVLYGWAGENLARNNYPDSESVAVAIRDLMNSPGHRANILHVEFTQMGVGFAVDGNMKYFTMVFVGPP
ncbi:MAG: hypothetical protein IIC88_00280 [Chloroflexi bacterium]|nr:hypothetical protein [Chloroflexota bacterium]